MRVYDLENYFREKLDISIRPSQVYYWEKKGLLKVKRTSKQRRDYDEDDIKEVLMIWMLNEINLSLRLIKQVVLDNDQKSKEIAAEKIVLLKTTIIPAIEKYLSR